VFLAVFLQNKEYDRMNRGERSGTFSFRDVMNQIKNLKTKYVLPKSQPVTSVSLRRDLNALVDRES
jgi:hypothetical protein